MSSPFVVDAEPEEVEVPCLCAGNHPNDVILVKRRLSARDVAVHDSAFFRIGMDGRADADQGAAGLAMLQIGVLGWNFLNEDGTAVPFNPELLELLDSAVSAPVVEHLMTKLQAAKNPTQAPGNGAVKLEKKRTRRS